MFRRPLRRRAVRMLRADIPPLLRRANEMLVDGDYSGAALAFEQLARGAQVRGLPRAGHLFLQAGRCHILAGQVPQGMLDLKQGLSFLTDRGVSREIAIIGQRITAELAQNGLPGQTEEIRQWLNSATPVPISPLPTHPIRKAVLPTVCPSCGGPIFSNEVEWVDEVTAACPYCGGGVRAE